MPAGFLIPKVLAIVGIFAASLAALFALDSWQGDAAVDSAAAMAALLIAGCAVLLVEVI